MLLEMDRAMRELNREVMNPVIPQLGIEDLKPAIAMVARARAHYLKQFLLLAEQQNSCTPSETNECVPSDEQIVNLRTARIAYDELASAAKAMETAIDRGYLDINP